MVRLGRVAFEEFGDCAGLMAGKEDYGRVR